MSPMLIAFAVTIFGYIMPGLIISLGLIVPLFALPDAIRYFLLRHSWIIEISGAYMAYQMHKGSWLGGMAAVVGGLGLTAICIIWRKCAHEDDVWPDGKPVKLTPSQKKAAKLEARAKAAATRATRESSPMAASDPGMPELVQPLSFS